MRRRIKDWTLVYRAVHTEQGVKAELWASTVPPSGMGIVAQHRLEPNEDRLPLTTLAETYPPPGTLLAGLDRHGWPWTDARR